MTRVFALVGLCIALLYGKVEPIKRDFEACYKRSAKSFIKKYGKDFVVVSKGKAITFSRKYLKHYIKRDPFLGLYLIRVPKGIPFVRFVPFEEMDKSGIVAVINKKKYDLSKVFSKGNGLNSFAKLDKKHKPNSLVECVCCRGFGLSAGGKSFIDSDFILRFLNNKKVVYADCGLQFTQKGDKIFVKEINPFFHDYGIRVGDRILSVDGKTFEDVSLLSKYILFSKPYKKIDIKFQRKNRIFHKKIKLKRKLSGGVLGENYLAYIGLYLRYDLKVSYVSKGSLADKLGIKKGDKLLKINQTYIRSYPQVKKVLSKLSGKFVYLLFDRDDFQFFVHFRR